MHRLAHALLSGSPRPGGTGVVSSWGLALALEMLRPGAIGRVADELDAALSPFVPAADLARAGEAFAVARHGFVDDDLPLRPSWVEAVELLAGQGAIEELDLATVGTERINAWVADATRGLVPSLLDDASGLDLALVSVLWLKASWSVPFDPHLTCEAPFTTLAGEQVAVPLMWREGRMGLARLGAGSGGAGSPALMAVRLPYATDGLAMWVLVGDDAAHDPVGLVTPGVLAAVAAAWQPTRVALRLPRFTLSGGGDLTALLPGLGLGSVLVDPAGLAGISTEEVVVDRVLQRTRVQVDEEGTEAAAATMIGVVRMTSIEQDPVTVTVDRPFAFVVVHEPTGTPLFTGTVGDPRS